MPPTLKSLGFTLSHSFARPGMERVRGVFEDPLQPHQRLGVKSVALLTGPLG